MMEDQAVAMESRQIDLQQRIEQLEQENAWLRERIEKLEQQLHRNSTNSSRPPSSDGPQVVRPKKQPTGRKRGAQAGHPGTHRARVPAHKVDRWHRQSMEGPCEHCRCQEVKDTQWRFVKQVWELPPIKPTVTQYEVQTGVCAGCGAQRTARLPDSTPRGYFGPRAHAAVATLTGCSHVSRRQTRFLLENLLGLPVSLGTVSTLEKRVSDSLHKPAKQVRALLRQEPVLHMDETGHKRAGVRRWNWVMCNDTYAAYRVGQRRSKRVQQQMQGNHFSGTIVCDNYSAYRHLPSQRKQLCLAHLLRPLEGLARRTCQLGKIAGQLVSDFRQLFHLHKSLRDDRARLQQESAVVRQRIHKTTLGAFLDHEELRPLGRLLYFRPQEIWNYLDNPALEMTNNQAERDIRPLVIWRKMSQGTQSVRGDRYMERIQTIQQTCRKQDRNPFVFIKNTLIAYWQGVRLPSLLPQPPPKGG